MGLFGRSADLFSMPNFEYKHLSHHFKFTSQQSKMNATSVSVERGQKYVFNFEIYRFVKKADNLSHPPLLLWISDPVRPRFLAITSSDLARSLSNFRTLHFSPSADFCQYGLLTKNR